MEAQSEPKIPEGIKSESQESDETQSEPLGFDWRTITIKQEY